MKKVLMEYLSFNKTERRGLFVLISLLVSLIMANVLLPLFFSPQHYDFSAFKKEIDAFEQGRVMLENRKGKNYSYQQKFNYSFPEHSVEQSKLAPCPFDPNKMEKADWEKLGLTGRQVNMLMNYRSKGGTFRCKADFKKMYCISGTEYEVLAPYLQLPETATKTSGLFPKDSILKKKSGLLIEINTAQADDFTKLKGVGEYFAGKIITYRNALGGFLQIEQLLEVPRMDSSRYLQILPNLTINPNAIRKKDVNTATFEELKSHPYIGHNIALSLTNYRQTHGKFAKLEDIKKSALVTDKVYRRLSPYLRVD